MQKLTNKEKKVSRYVYVGEVIHVDRALSLVPTF